MDEEENTMMPGADDAAADDMKTDTSTPLGEEMTTEKPEAPEMPETPEDDDEEDELPSMAAPSSE